MNAVSGLGNKCPLSSGSLIYPKLGSLPINFPISFLFLKIERTFLELSLLVISLNTDLKGIISLPTLFKKVST